VGCAEIFAQALPATFETRKKLAEEAHAQLELLCQGMADGSLWDEDITSYDNVLDCVSATVCKMDGSNFDKTLSKCEKALGWGVRACTRT
jgi:hypothetical protein